MQKLGIILIEQVAILDSMTEKARKIIWNLHSLIDLKYIESHIERLDIGELLCWMKQ